jgi:hypothetical protein
MRESFDHCPPGWIRQSRKRCAQFIHNHMVVDNLAMSSVKFALGTETEPSSGVSSPTKKLTIGYFRQGRRRNAGPFGPG